MWLVDTSAWIEFFRRSRHLQLADLAPGGGSIVTCLPVLQEVLQGIDDERAFAAIRTAMVAWPVVDDPLSSEVIDDAVHIYRQARRAGLTIRSNVDCLIAASALRHGLTVVHCDRDFSAIAKVSGLRHLDLGPRLTSRR